MPSTSVAYRAIATRLPAALARTAAEPAVARAATAYRAAIAKVRGIDDFLKDDRSFRFAMTAYGLGDMAYAKGFMRKVLAGGAASGGFAAGLTDPRFRAFAKAFDFARYGPAATTFPAAAEGAVDRYVRQALEEEAGAQNEGVRLALTFARKIGAVTTTTGLLADRALVQVVRTALGIEAAAGSTLDAQTRLIEGEVKLADLKTPQGEARFLARFAARWDATHEEAQPLGLLPAQDGAAVIGLGVDLLARLQSVRRG